MYSRKQTRQHGTRNKKRKIIAFSAVVFGVAVLAAICLPMALKKDTDGRKATASLSVNNAVSIRSMSPAHNAEVKGVQELRAEVQGNETDDFIVYWTVNDGPLNPMQDDPKVPGQKVASVDVSAWDPQYPHEIAYVATTPDGEVELGRLDMAVKVTASSPVAPGSTAKPKAATAPVIASIPKASAAKAVAGLTLYVDPNNPAAKQAADWRASKPAEAALMDKLAAQPQAKWFGSWTSNVQTAVSTYVGAAAAVNQVPIMVLYAIPQIDCSSASGGLAGYDHYVAWVQQVVNGIAGRRALVVLEPDALACVTKPGMNQDQRYKSLSKAVDLLKSSANTTVYIDAGHAKWVNADEMAQRLVKANVAKADGFSLNVSNFVTTDANITYGNSLSGKLNGRRFVIDTSRNGLGPSADSQWCNPPGRAVGLKPSTSVPHANVDAYLWIKIPGESDGNWGGCGGGPAPGQWWADYALGLIQRAAW